MFTETCLPILTQGTNHILKFWNVFRNHSVYIYKSGVLAKIFPHSKFIKIGLRVWADYVTIYWTPFLWPIARLSLYYVYVKVTFRKFCSGKRDSCKFILTQYLLNKILKAKFSTIDINFVNSVKVIKRSESIKPFKKM